MAEVEKRRGAVRVAVTAAVIAGLWFHPARPAASEAGAADPFAFFSPFVKVTTGERARLATGQVVARALPADDGHLAVFAASRYGARPAALIEWTQAIDALKRGPLVLAVGRFSSPPRLSDLDGLTVESGDVEALRRCAPGNCEVKLAGSEITAIRRAASDAGPDWRAAIQQEFRRTLLERVRLHQESGLAAIPAYADKGRQVSLGTAFSTIVQRSPYLLRAFPEVVEQLQNPTARDAADETLYYWSSERYGGRIVITLTYVRLLEPATGPPAPAAMSVSAQLFASHYTEAALGVTAVVCETGQTTCYLAYLNQTRVDVLGGLFGGLKRALIEQRIESDTPALLRAVRQRLESGPPPHGPLID